MALAAWQSTITNESGDIQAAAQVTVLIESSGAFAALFSDRDGASPIDNPVTADDDGFVRFYAVGNAYRITAALGGFSRVWRHVPVGILGERDELLSTQIKYDRTPAEIAAGVTPVDYARPPGDALRFGDDGPAIQEMIDAAILEEKSFIIIPPGDYHTATQIVVDAPARRRLGIYAYGAQITTENAISGFELFSGASSGGATLFGLTIDHQDNADATCGFDIHTSYNIVLMDCSVIADDVSATYAGIRLRNGTPSVSSTGALWTRIYNAMIKRVSGAGGANMPYGILVRGNSNATNIIGGNIQSSDIGIGMTHESGQVGSPNALFIEGTAFESCTDAIRSNAETSNPLSGCRIIGCRAEAGTNFLNLQGATTQPAVPTYLAGNYLISSVSNYLVNPNNLYVTSLDFSVTPNISPGPILVNQRGLKVRVINGAAHVFQARAPSAGFGYSLLDSSDVEQSTWVTRAAGGASLTQIKQIFSTADGTGANMAWTTTSPEGVVTAPPGSIRLSTGGGAGTTLYVKESGTGNTGWVGK
jgi:hypothetical protein